MTRPLLFFIVLAVCAGLDALARRAGGYGDTVVAWPELVRLRRRVLDGDRPYRAAAPEDWHRVMPAGVPMEVSTPTLFLGIFNLSWTLALTLAAGDIPRALLGHRALPFTLASFAWCASRMTLGWAMAFAAMARRPRRFWLTAMLVSLMDATLARLPVPCSDNRADDVAMAEIGLGVTASLALGFAIALWRRRGALSHHAYRAMH